MLYLEVQINEHNVAPLLIFRKDDVEAKLEEFSYKYMLEDKKRHKLKATVAAKMKSLNAFVPEANDLSPMVIDKGELELTLDGSSL